MSEHLHGSRRRRWRSDRLLSGVHTRRAVLILFLASAVAMSIAVGRLTASPNASAATAQYPRLVRAVTVPAGNPCHMRRGGLVARVRVPRLPVSVDYAWRAIHDSSWTFSSAEPGPIALWGSFGHGSGTERILLSFSWSRGWLWVTCTSDHRLFEGIRVRYDVVMPADS